jgi:hypothetical protein
MGGELRIKRIKRLKVNCYDFKIIWDKTHNGGSFSYKDLTITIGVKAPAEEEILMIICHEVMEIVAVEAHVRLERPDVHGDYVFVYDHRQHSSMMCMFSGLISQFIE